MEAPAGRAGASDEGRIDLILDLRQVGRGDLAAAGRKRANLGGLTSAGLPVPAGFLVSTAADDRFVAQNGLDETIARGAVEEPGGRRHHASSLHGRADSP